VYDDELASTERNRPLLYERTADRTTERAMGWLRELASPPFFLWVHYQDPHGPYGPPEAFLEPLPSVASEAEPELPVLRGQSGYRGIPAYQALGELRRPSEYRRRYAGEVRYADHWIGELLAALSERGWAEDTVVLLTADHGESLGEAGFFFVHGHAATPDQSHVPLILRAPGLEPQRREELVGHVDVMPTLLELAGIDVPRATQGVALGSHLRDADPIPERLLFCDFPGGVGAYRGHSFLRFPLARAGSHRRPAPSGHRWTPSGGLSSAPEVLQLSKQVRDYVLRSVPTEEIGPLPPRQTERLRALGYIEPEAGAE